MRIHCILQSLIQTQMVGGIWKGKSTTLQTGRAFQQYPPHHHYICQMRLAKHHCNTHRRWAINKGHSWEEDKSCRRGPIHNKPKSGLTLQHSPKAMFRTMHTVEVTDFKRIFTHIHMLLAALQLWAFYLGPRLPLALWYLFHRLLPKCSVGYAGKCKLVKETTWWFIATQVILPLSLQEHTRRMTFGFCCKSEK